MIRNFHSAFPAAILYTPICLHRRSFCIRFHPKDQGVFGRAFAGTKNQDLFHFEALFRTPPPSTPRCRPDWFCLAAAPIRLAAANPPCAAACFRTSAALDGLLTATGRNIGRYRTEGRFFVNPDTKQQADILGTKVRDIPALMLLRQNGEEEKGWRGLPFWWPVQHRGRVSDARSPISAERPLKHYFE